jgi:hypothetical protein
MKKIIILLFVSLFFIASTCKKEGENCHYDIQIINNSANQIISAIPIQNAVIKCKLDGKKIEVNDTYNYYPFIGCIENSLQGNSSTLEIYIVDPNHFNEPGVFYDCDSIEIKNTILKHYVLYLEDLKENNFTVTYP